MEDYFALVFLRFLMALADLWGWVLRWTRTFATVQMVLLNIINKLLNYLIVSLFWSPMIRPRQIVKLNDFPQLSILCDVYDFQFEPYEICHHTFARHEYYLHYLSILLKSQALSNLRWPVLVALCLPMLLALCEIDDELAVFLQDHSPKVFFRRRQRALSRNECLIIDLKHRINVISIDIWVCDVCTPLD